MALVRKYNKAGKVEEPKKVLTYENVGTYDAEKLASELTLNLENYADNLRLTGLDRLDFLNYGSIMILAVKDGNVTKNANGTYSINGNYGLNNTYTDALIANKRAKGEVGRGASKYQGSHQPSYGIFTTLGTEDFRNRNHTLGLVGLWLNNTLNSAKIIDPKTQTFDISRYLLEELYHSSPDFLIEWNNVYKDEKSRLTLLDAVLGNLTDQDYAEWAKSDSSVGSVEDLHTKVNILRESLKNGDTAKARADALKLGFVLPKIITLASGNDNNKQNPELTEEDLRSSAIRDLGIDADEYQISLYIDSRKKLIAITEENERIAKLQDLIEKLWEQFKIRESYNQREWYTDDNISTPGYLLNKDKFDLLLDALERHKEFIDTPPALDSEEGLSLGNLIDSLTDAYFTLDKWTKNDISDKLRNTKDFDHKAFIKNAQILKDILFSSVTYNGTVYVKINGLSTLKYSVLLDPKHPDKPVTRIFNGLLDKESREYDLIHKEFLQKYSSLLADGGGITLSNGATVDFGVLARGDSILNGTLVLDIPTDSGDAGGNGNNNGTGNENTDDSGPFAEPLKFSDWARLTSAGLDLTALIASSTGLGGVSVGAGFASTTADLIANVAENGLDLGDVGNALGGYALDALSFIPYTRWARMSKIGLTLVKYSPHIFGAAAVAGIVLTATDIDNFKKSFNNLANGKLTSQDVQRLAGFFSLVTGLGARYLTHRRGKLISEHAVDTPSVKGSDGKTYTISPTELNEIEIKPYDEANNIFRGAIAESKKIKLEDVDINLPFTTVTKGEASTKRPKLDVEWKSEIEPFTEVTGGGTRSRRVAGTIGENNMVNGDLPRLFDGIGKINPRSAVFDAPFILDKNTKLGLGMFNIHPTPLEGVFEYKHRLYKKQPDGSYLLIGNLREEAALRDKLSKSTNTTEKAADTAEKTPAPKEPSLFERAMAKFKSIGAKTKKEPIYKKKEPTAADKDPGAPDSKKMEGAKKSHTNVESPEYDEFLRLNEDKSYLEKPSTLFKIDEKTIVSLREEIELFNKRNGTNIPLDEDISQAAASFIIGSNDKYRAKYQPQPESGSKDDAAVKGAAPAGSEYDEFLKLDTREGPLLKPNSLFVGSKGKAWLNKEIEFFNARNGTNIPTDKSINSMAAQFILDSNEAYRAKNAPELKKKASRKKLRGGKKLQGGILDIVVDVTEILKAGGIIKAAKGRKISHKGKDLYGSQDFAEWLKTIDNSVTYSEQDEDFDDSDWNWKAIMEDIHKILGSDTSDTSDDIALGNLYGPNRLQYENQAGVDAARKRETSEFYKEFTDYIVLAMQSGNLSPRLREYLQYLLDQFRAKYGSQSSHFVDYITNGVVNASSIEQYQNLRTDSGSSHGKYSMGPHHHLASKRGIQKHYYINNKEVNADARTNDEWRKATQYEVYDDDNKHIYFVLNDSNDGLNGGNPNGGGQNGGQNNGQNGGLNTGSETLTTANQDIYNGLDLTNRINWANVNETLRVLALNGQNQRAFEQSIDWLPHQLGYLNRYGILKGNKPVVDQANENAARLNYQAGQTYSNDAATQLAGQLEATDKGNQGKMQAALADTQEFFRTQERNQNIANEDLAYNRKAADTNLELISAKEKETALERAALTLAKATNLSTLMQGFSKQMFSRYNSIAEMLKQRQLLKEANRRAAAARVFQAKIDALDPSNYDQYVHNLEELQRKYLETIGEYDKEDIDTMRKIIGRRIILTPDLKGHFAKKGRKLSAENHYILLGSKDYNKRQLAEAREFYKNIRENNKKRK